jgi:hypothetical protein
MADLSEIEKNYKTLSTFELLKIAKDPVGLRPEVIPILQHELITRGETEEAQKVSERLNDSAEEEALAMEHLTPEEIESIVKDRLAAGESIESIRIKLKENGVNLYGDLEKEGEFQKQTFDYLYSLKEKGLSENQIKQDLQEKLSMSEDAAAELTHKLRKKGRRYLIGGYVMLGISILGIGAMAASGRLSFRAIAVLILGIGSIARGHTILKKL